MSENMKSKFSVFLMFSSVFWLYSCYNIFSPLFVDPSEEDISKISDVNFLNDMGDYYSELGNYATAKKYYERALQINAKSARALVGTASCEIFLLFSRSNVIGFYEEVSHVFSSISNYDRFIDYYITNTKYYSSSRIVSRNLYAVISGNSDNLLLKSDDNLHLTFSVFNKLYSFFVALDSNSDNVVSGNDRVYTFIKHMTNSSDPNFVLPNDFVFHGDEVNNAMLTFFDEGKKSIDSLVFITNKFKSAPDSIEMKILDVFISIDVQVSNIYTNFLRYYDFYNSMYNRIVFLITNNGIPLEYATNLHRLTNAMRVISNYSTFDGRDITNILNTDISNAWNILINYLDIKILTNG
ncbi:MAG: tetratricopeptide repeat protein [Brevinematales bacterium]|nr:tetratricopeptide repeat protein [Brevinematales bacterium]